MITLTINGKEVQVEKGLTILEAARGFGISIPTLCYHEALLPYSGCRLCLVETFRNGKSKLVASCSSLVEEGLVIKTDSERVLKARKWTLELLLSRCPKVEKIQELAANMDVKEPRFKTKDENERCILCGLCVRVCKERMGASVISFAERGPKRSVTSPFKEYSEVCMGCGACSFVCPTDAIKPEEFCMEKLRRISSEFDQGLGPRPAVYLPYPQAIPNKATIDSRYCVHIQNGKCEICKEFCGPGAIDFDQKEQTEEINVGALIFATGFDRFNPQSKLEYGYGVLKNVITSPELERILSASGPFEGHLIRPSDGKEPKRIAFVQCVGSRDVECNPYCSSVCCMYAIKEAVVAKEHAKGELECDIYFMDLRAYGKGFDRYYERAKQEYKINFHRSRIPEIEKAPDSEDLILKFEDEDGILEKERYDLVVLSTGLMPPSGIEKLKERFGIKLNKYNFVETSEFSKEDTSREGMYVCGASSEPKDIPETVIQASAAAARSSELLAPVRSSLIKEKVYPEEINIVEEPPRVGVFVCHCGINIAGVVDVKQVVESTKKLPNVVYTTDNLYTCSQDTQEVIKALIKEHRLNRIVIASCTPRTHEPLFQDTIREAGLNPFLLEFVSIREMVSWVHMHEKRKATEKAKELVAMAIAKGSLLKPLIRESSSVNKKGLVIGGGIAGMTAALSLAQQGFETYLVEKEQELGGNLRNIYFGFNGSEPQKLLKETVEKIEKNNKIHIYKNYEITNFSGYMGNYKTTITSRESSSTNHQLEHGIVIVATGAKEKETSEYLYGKSDRIITQRELEEKLTNNQLPITDYRSVVMIQCVGSREEGCMYCSRVCCSKAIKNAIKIKEINPATKIFVLYRDIRTYGFKEEYYQRAREKGVIFINYDLKNKPEVNKEGEKISVNIFDPILWEKIELNPDLLVLSTGIVPDEGNKSIGRLLKVPLNEDNFFLEAHIKLRPVDFSTDGIFLCGLAHSPKFVEESISQARAAAARAVTILSKDNIQATGRTVWTNERLCIGCGVCIPACPYEAREIDEETGKIRVTEVLCQGCGACVASCPNGAAQQFGFEKKELLEAVDAVL